MPTATLAAIRSRMITRYELGRQGTHDGGAVTTPADDSQFGGPAGEERVEVGCELLISDTTDDLAPLGEIGRVSQRPTLSGGTITIDPPPTVAMTNADTFEVLYRPLRFENLRFAVNEALEQFIIQKLLVPLTLVTDGDMLKAGVTDWTVSSATQAKSAASFPLGLRELHVENTGANGYTASVAIPVEAGETYYLEAMARVLSTPATNTARLVLRDLTNGANITLDENNSTQQEPEILRNDSVTMPTGCERVEIRLGGDEADADVFWSNIIFRKNSARFHVVHDRPGIDRLGQLFVMTGTEWRERDKYAIHSEPTMLPDGLWEYRTANISGQAIFYEEFVKRGTLSADTDTAAAPEEDIAAVATAILLEELSLQDDPDWQKAFLRAARDASKIVSAYHDQLRVYDTPQRVHVLPEV